MTRWIPSGPTFYTRPWTASGRATARSACRAKSGSTSLAGADHLTYPSVTPPRIATVRTSTHPSLFSLLIFPNLTAFPMASQCPLPL